MKKILIHTLFIACCAGWFYTILFGPAVQNRDGFSLKECMALAEGDGEEGPMEHLSVVKENIFVRHILMLDTFHAMEE